MAEDKKNKKIIFLGAEKSKARANFWEKLGDADYNPDNVSFRIYNKMLLDAQVRSGIEVLKLLSLAKGFGFNYPGENEELGNEMKAYLRKAFSMVNSTIFHSGGIREVFKDMIENAVAMGYCVSEIVYMDEIDPDDGKIYMKKWKVLPRESLEDCFGISDFGDLEKVTQYRKTGLDEVVFEGDDDFFRLVIWSHNKTGSNWYGRSDLRVIYKNWFIKEYLIKFWNIALERYGAPFLVMYVEDDDALEEANEHLDKARTKTNFTVTEGNKIEVIESDSNGMFGYEKGIRYHDEQIFRGLLIPTLVLGIEQTGARSLGDTHFDLLILRIKDLQAELAAAVEIQIKRMIDLNFSNVDAYPTLEFPALVSKDKKNLADMIATLIDKGVIQAEEKWIRTFLEIPQSDDGVMETSPPQDDDGESDD